ncbi:uncharacterized protein LOC126190755 [Schistocerca cancellata]|uniref:uncharacterized protein LOC126190755 n=1 Tax=Schistocerca cancellata TaxID=274614 RepID=UPI002118DB14|nr:uncharacterized protein LOC126190755 [Schistocerca cancellata]
MERTKRFQYSMYMKEMVLLDGANDGAEAATSEQPSDQVVPGPSGSSTKDSANTSTPPHKKLKVKGYAQRDTQEEMRNYLKEWREMKRERRKKRRQMEIEKLALTRASIEVTRASIEVTRASLEATLETNKLLQEVEAEGITCHTCGGQWRISDCDYKL